MSVVPSVLLAAWVWLLWACGAVTGRPSLAHIGERTPSSSVESALIIAALAIAVAVVLHPLQFAIVQLLEGYWGGSRVGRAFQVKRQVAHLHRLERAVRDKEQQEDTMEALEESGIRVETDLLEADPVRRTQLMRSLSAASAAVDLIVTFPDNPQQIMATRLGNVLRRAEMRAGRPYGLPILLSATHLGMVADPAHTAYVDDQRTRLDLTARICAFGLLATIASAAVMWPHGLWLLTALIPYGAAYLAYRGAVVAATSYGQALSAWTDLNRFALYQALHLNVPASAAEERKQNQKVRDLLMHVATFTAEYDSVPSTQSSTLQPSSDGPSEVEADSG